MIPPKLAAWLLLVTALWLGGCASSTRLVSTWSAPDIAPIQLKKILVTCPAAEKSLRLAAEVRMMQRIPGAVTSTSVFLNGEEGDIEKVKAKIRELGFDGVVILRPVAIDKDTEYRPPSVSTYAMTGRRLYGYWGTSYATVYDPGYSKQTVLATVETEVYAVEGEKLLWISRSQTLDPDGVNDGIDSIIDSNITAMREQGLLASR